MTTLHERLQEAVNERLRIAEAFVGACGGSHGWCGDECEEYQAYNDPARIIRDCQRDLRVLGRHRLREIGGSARSMCEGCSITGGSVLLFVEWPCPEIKDLAEAYQIDGSTT